MPKDRQKDKNKNEHEDSLTYFVRTLNEALEKTNDEPKEEKKG